MEQISDSVRKNHENLEYYDQKNDGVIESTQLQRDRPFFKNCVAIFNQGNKAHVVQLDKQEYTVKTICSSVLRPFKTEDAKGLNRLLASHFEDD